MKNSKLHYTTIRVLYTECVRRTKYGNPIYEVIGEEKINSEMTFVYKFYTATNYSFAYSINNCYQNYYVKIGYKMTRGKPTIYSWERLNNKAPWEE